MSVYIKIKKANLNKRPTNPVSPQIILDIFINIISVRCPENN